MSRLVPDPRPAWAAEPSPLTVAGCVRAFSETDAYTVGVEEELMLLQPGTLQLGSAVERVFEQLGDDARFARELRTSTIESLTPAASNAAEAQDLLHGARRDLIDATRDFIRVAAAGSHPSAKLLGTITRGERYAELAADYPWAATRGLMCGLHVHVAVGDAERALAVFNALRSYVPELSALGANAPFFEGVDTGLASVRPLLNESFPRAGVPPALGSWDEFVALVEWGRRGGSFPDETYLWWDIRPQPRFGTIELRIPDAATRVVDAGALAAVSQALVAWLGDRHDAGEELRVHDGFRIGENAWSALRHGVGGWLLDYETGEPEPTRDRLSRLLDSLEQVAERLGIGRQLEHARTLIVDNGADRQRYVHERQGIDGLLAWLVEASDPLPAAA